MHSDAPPSRPQSDTLGWLGQLVDVTVDRPLGSAHPARSWRYPVNYGYVPGTVAGDGEPWACYLLGVCVPVGRFGGVVAAVVLRGDDEDKLVVAPPGWDGARMAAALAFAESRFDATVVDRDGNRHPVPAAP